MAGNFHVISRFFFFLSLALCVGFPGICPRFTAIPSSRAGISVTARRLKGMIPLYINQELLWVLLNEHFKLFFFSPLHFLLNERNTECFNPNITLGNCLSTRNSLARKSCSQLIMSLLENTVAGCISISTEKLYLAWSTLHRRLSPCKPLNKEDEM